MENDRNRFIHEERGSRFMTKLLIHLFVKNNTDIQNPEVRKQYGTLAGAAGIVCNLFLFCTKLFAGFITGSISITADAFNNLSDAGSSIMTLIGFRMAGKPADNDHPYGHGRIEYISGLLVAIVIVLMGFELFMSSVQKILHPQEITFEIASVLILILSIGIKFWMSRFNTTLGDRIHSSSMKATALDSLSDCVATTAVLVGMFISHWTGFNLDGFLGICVSCFILFAGYNAAKDTIAPLLGQTPDPEFLERLSEKLTSRKEMVGYHDLIIHDYGPGRVMVTVHGEVPYPMDIMKAHNVIDEIENEIKRELGCNISIHMDPVVLDDKEANELKAFCEEMLKKIDERLTLHDFRMTKSPSRSKLIFDVEVPFDYKVTQKELSWAINRELVAKYPACYAVIEVDYGYL